MPFQGPEHREDWGGEPRLGEDPDGGVEGEDAGVTEVREHAGCEARREAADEAGGDEVILVDAEAEDAGVDLEGVREGKGALEENGQSAGVRRGWRGRGGGGGEVGRGRRTRMVAGAAEM